MNLTDIMCSRRSVRKYTGESIPEEKLDLILKAGLLIPSGKSKYPQELILVKDKQILEKLSKCREMGSKFLAGADGCIVVVGNAELSDTWDCDCSIAMAHMHLMAESLGVGSCWIQGRGRMAAEGVSTDSYVRDLLNYPQEYKLLAILSLGIAEKKGTSRDPEDLPTEKIHREKF